MKLKYNVKPQNPSVHVSYQSAVWEHFNEFKLVTANKSQVTDRDKTVCKICFNEVTKLYLFFNHTICFPFKMYLKCIELKILNCGTSITKCIISALLYICRFIRGGLIGPPLKVEVYVMLQRRNRRKEKKRVTVVCQIYVIYSSV